MINRRRFVQRSLALAAGTQIPFAPAWPAILSPSGIVDTDIDAFTGDGAGITLSRASVQELGDSLRGDLLLPGHSAYDEARLLRNASINKFPALIVQPTGVTDIRNAVDFARSENLLLAVKCGGHSHSGKSSCDGGMMIDLSRLRGVRVEPTAKRAQVEGGSLLGDLDHETTAYDLVTTAGTVSHTGVGGLTLGGGFGRVARRYGLSLDNVLSYDIVTADGRFLHASPDENADLYWGLRGGGGNFGIVTNFEFQLHEMDREVIGGQVFFPLSQSRQLLEFYADYQEQAPQELALDAGMYNLRGMDPFFAFDFCYSGPKNQAERLLEIVRSAGTVINDTVRPIHYAALQRSGDDTDPRGAGSYTKSGFSAHLTGAFIDAILDGFEARPDVGTIFAFQHCGGAINEIPADTTAFPHRNITLTPLLVVDWAITRDPTDDITWLRQYWASVEPHIQGFYTNDLIDETQEQVNDNYLGNYSRLVALKNRYDPTNLFRLNANVSPAG
jgi:FAD/FMN-containing dehydrogenase